MIRPIAAIAAVCCLTLLVAACGGDSGGSPTPSSQPQSSATPASEQASASASPVAAADAGADAAAPAGDTQAQDDNQYGQPAPETRERDDPQAAWKIRRDADAAAASADTPAG